ncbi:MAG: GTP-binding protein, partial [Bacteroidetes bacterium]
MDLLRFSTAGSVDDGKSTLIGRLLYDTKSIFEDQLESIEHTSQARGDDYLDLALLTDGLKAEREQGITIDVAYRYFATPRRKFILADTPGHIQYTRNMVTGASTVNLAIILVDARHGVVEQTRRHSFIASLLQIKHLIVAVNKMDLVDFQEEAFQQVKEGFASFSSKLNVPDIRYIPISALRGDNVVTRSENMPWYEGSPLLYTLETVHVGNDLNHVDSRFPVQYVIRPQSDQYRDYRGYAGRVAGGVFKPGDEVMVLPSGFTTRVKSIDTYDGPVDEAFAPMSVTMTLEDEIDISRGDMIVKPENQAQVSQDLEMMICWMNEKALVPRGKYRIRHTTRDARCIVKDVRYKVDVNTLHRVEDDKTLGLNDIGRILIR